MPVATTNIKLDEFIQNEIKRTLNFASKWREMHKDSPIIFPLNLENEKMWYGQYINFLRGGKPQIEEDKKEETAEVAPIENTTTSDAA